MTRSILYFIFYIWLQIIDYLLNRYTKQKNLAAQIKQQNMNRSRKRQFDQFRSHASNASVRSQLNSMQSSKVSQSTVSQACVNCVNKMLADRHKKIAKQEKERQKEDFKKNIQQVNAAGDPQRLYRQQLKGDALNYNSRMIQQQKNSKIHQKQQDVKYAQMVNKNFQQAEKSMKNQFEAQKQKQNEYYNQIHNQYIKQLQKKDKERFHKDRQQEKADGLPLFNPDTTQQKLNYKRQLERQMQQKKSKQIQEKIRNQNKQRQLLEQSKKEADKYHADNYEAIKMSKQEVFQGLKNLQTQKKKKVEEQRKNNDEMRMKQIKQQNQFRSKAIKYKMQEMQKYVDGLKNQLLQKQQKLKMSKVSDRNFFEKLPKSTQQVHAQLQVRKQCKSCHKNYPQEMIGPVPKMA